MLSHTETKIHEAFALHQQAHDFLQQKKDIFGGRFCINSARYPETDFMQVLNNLILETDSGMPRCL